MNKTLSKCLCVMLFIFTVIFLVAIFIQSRETWSRSAEGVLNRIQMSGEYQTDETKEWTPFEKLSEIPIDQGNITLRGHLQDKILEGNKVMLYLDHLTLTFSLNGKEIYHSRENVEICWDFITSQGITPQDEVVMQVQEQKSRGYVEAFQKFFDKFYYGDRFTLHRKQISDHIVKIFICIIIWTLGVASIVTGAALRYLKISGLDGYLECGLLLMAGAICMAIDYEYITLIFNQPIAINAIDLLSQMFICEFLFLYLKVYITVPWKRLFVDGVATLWGITIVCYMLFRALGITTEDQMLTPLFIELIPFFIIVVGLVFSEYFRNSDKRSTYVFLSSIFLVAMIVVEIIHYYFANSFWVIFFLIGIVLFAATQFAVIIIYSKQGILQAARAKKLEKELNQNRIMLVLSRMNPNFLERALQTIRKLCSENPADAENAINYFEKYIRANMDFLSSEKCIPFREELEHVKNYLCIEKLNLGDSLQIDYQLETEDFLCPPFVLQNIVENAVRHGIGDGAAAGIIMIATHEANDSYVIQVMDNGNGFDVDKALSEEKGALGIKNVRMSLKTMCDGTIFIESYRGNGTTVRMELPKENVTAGMKQYKNA